MKSGTTAMPDLSQATNNVSTEFFAENKTRGHDMFYDGDDDFMHDFKSRVMRKNREPDRVNFDQMPDLFQGMNPD